MKREFRITKNVDFQYAACTYLSSICEILANTCWALRVCWTAKTFPLSHLVSTINPMKFTVCYSSPCVHSLPFPNWASFCREPNNLCKLGFPGSSARGFWVGSAKDISTGRTLVGRTLRGSTNGEVTSLPLHYMLSPYKGCFSMAQLLLDSPSLPCPHSH